MTEININGEIYVKKSELPTELAETTDGMRYVIVRTYSAGVHAGWLVDQSGKEVVLKNARRLWYWSGAFTLSEIATKGVNAPDECKFSCTVPKITLTEAIEIIPCTEEGKASILGVKDYES